MSGYVIFMFCFFVQFVINQCVFVVYQYWLIQFVQFLCIFEELLVVYIMEVVVDIVIVIGCNEVFEVDNVYFIQFMQMVDVVRYQVIELCCINSQFVFSGIEFQFN